MRKKAHLEVKYLVLPSFEALKFLSCWIWPKKAYFAPPWGIRKNIHPCLRYLSHNKTVVTSSRDPLASIIIMHIANKLDSYIFKLAWGVRCFDLRQEVGVLATGSNDMMVRLWNPVVTSRPTSVLGGHKAGIIDIKIYVSKRFVFSYSKDAVIKLWDLGKG